MGPRRQHASSRPPSNARRIRWRRWRGGLMCVGDSGRTIQGRQATFVSVWCHFTASELPRYSHFAHECLERYTHLASLVVEIAVCFRACWDRESSVSLDVHEGTSLLARSVHPISLFFFFNSFISNLGLMALAFQDQPHIVAGTSFSLSVMLHSTRVGQSSRVFRYLEYVLSMRRRCGRSSDEFQPVAAINSPLFVTSSNVGHLFLCSHSILLYFHNRV